MAINVILINQAHHGPLRCCGLLLLCHIYGPRTFAKSGSPGIWSPTSPSSLNDYLHWATRVLLWSQVWVSDEGETSQFLETFPSSLPSLLKASGIILFFSLAPPKEERHWLLAPFIFYTAKNLWIPDSKVLSGNSNLLKRKKKNKERTNTN